MTPRITKFTFEIKEEPLYFGAGHPVETLDRYTVRVTVDGKVMQYQQLYPEVQPFESVVQYFTRKAVAALHTALEEKAVASAAVAR